MTDLTTDNATRLYPGIAKDYFTGANLANYGPKAFSVLISHDKTADPKTNLLSDHYRAVLTCATGEKQVLARGTWGRAVGEALMALLDEVGDKMLGIEAKFDIEAK